MRLRFLPLYLFIISVGIFVLPFMTKAASPSSISVNIAPESPAPRENVNITLTSYINNLDSVLISWSVDGKNVLADIGKKSFSFNAPDAGQETKIVANIALPDGNIEKTIIIRPAIMTLLWQAEDSYVPPFYRGKTLPTPESNVRVVAMPEVKNGSQVVNPKNMVYAWKKDYNNDQTNSGYGKNFYIYINDYLDDSNNISVNASTTDQSYSSSASIDIGTYQPKIIFYKNDINLGTLWEQALSNGHKIIGDEILEAAPYFLSPQDLRIPILTWDWSINNVFVNSSGTRKNLLPIKVQQGISGTSKIKLEINNTYKLFENAKKEINVEF